MEGGGGGFGVQVGGCCGLDEVESRGIRGFGVPFVGADGWEMMVVWDVEAGVVGEGGRAGLVAQDFIVDHLGMRAHEMLQFVGSDVDGLMDRATDAQ